MKHQAIISGVRAEGARGVIAPTILRFTEADFVKVFLAEMRSPDWRERIEARRVAPGADGVPVIEQPVHRAFHLALVDARCLAAGMPRLDPGKIVSSGLVIRRLRGGAVAGWMRGKNGLPLGWRTVPAGALDPLSSYDPDARLRRARLEGRNAALLARLDRLPGEGDAASEDTAPLFPVPPDIAAHTGSTFLFGFLPCASNETEPEESNPAPPFSHADVEARLPGLFGADRSGVTLPPVASNIARAEMVRPEDAPDAARGSGLRTLKSALTWLAQECGAFGGSAEAAAIRSALNGVTLDGTSPSGYFDWLDAAQRTYLLQDPAGTDPIRTPDTWPALSSGQRTALIDAALAAMTVRWGDVAPLTGRYPSGRTRYELRCFVRIGDCPDCPPRIAWSPPSAPFRVKPWYEGSDAPPIQIELPPLSLDSLKQMKPNVAFKVPPELQQHLDRIDLGNLMDGKHTRTSVSFGMICGFSIPIITICAFIILQIFLQLLNIVFQWLLWVRICIPFPIVTTDEEDG